MNVISSYGVVAASVACTGWLAFQLLARNGRMLARPEPIERSIQPDRRVEADGVEDARGESLKQCQLLRDGLPVGSPAPDFRLPRVLGGELALSQYRGRRVLLLFSDLPRGPFKALLADLQRRYAAGSEVDVVMVSQGDRATNASMIAKLRVTFPVVLQRQREVSTLYRMFAAPVGVLVDERGVIAAPAAIGPERILALIPETRLVETYPSRGYDGLWHREGALAVTQ